MQKLSQGTPIYEVENQSFWVMPMRCVAAECSKTTKDGVSLHLFPTDPNLRRIWTTKVKTTRVKWDGPTQYSALCSDHFVYDVCSAAARLIRLVPRRHSASPFSCAFVYVTEFKLQPNSQRRGHFSVAKKHINNEHKLFSLLFHTLNT